MRRIISCIVLSTAVAMVGFGQDARESGKTTMHGYVVDAMCAKGMAKKDNPMDAAAKHTKECALEEGCASSGYGLFSEAKWYKFDEVGDKAAKGLIEGSKTEKGMMIEVTGELKGDKLAVASITEYKMEEKKMEKKGEEVEDEDEDEKD